MLYILEPLGFNNLFLRIFLGFCPFFVWQFFHDDFSSFLIPKMNFSILKNHINLNKNDKVKYIHHLGQQSSLEVLVVRNLVY